MLQRKYRHRRVLTCLRLLVWNLILAITILYLRKHSGIRMRRLARSSQNMWRTWMSTTL